MCLEALASVPWPVGPDSRPLSFGPREARVFDIGLPRRFMSGECPIFRYGGAPVLTFGTADGICAIQPFVVPGKVSAHVSPLNAYSATAAVIQRCVGGNPSQGGQVRSFGECRGIFVGLALAADPVQLTAIVQKAITISLLLCRSMTLTCGVVRCIVLEAQADPGL